MDRKRTTWQKAEQMGRLASESPHSLVKERRDRAGDWGVRAAKLASVVKDQGFCSKEPVATRPQGGTEGF